jgi:hypothetical protein
VKEYEEEMIMIEDLFRWKGLIYWGTALPNAKFNNLEDIHQRNETNNQQVLLYGSVNVNTFDNILNDWKKIEVAGCGKKIRLIYIK